MATVLVADDDPDILRLVTRLLEGFGHTVVQAADGQAALKGVFDRKPDLVVLDIGMPKMGGWQVLERIREVSDVPVLMLTAQGDELDKVRGLRSGADDFVTKPFGRQELVARVDALLRRRALSAGSAPDADVYIDSALTVDHTQRLAQAGDVELRLTPLEFRLLAVLVRNAGQLLSGQQLVELVWGDHFASADQVKLLVGRLRRKLAEQPGGPEIETVRGFGYRFVPTDR